MSLPEDAEIEVQLDRVEISGDSEGRIYTTFFFDGKVLEFSDYEGARWIYSEGQCWEEPEDWQSSCQGVDVAPVFGSTEYGGPPNLQPSRNMSYKRYWPSRHIPLTKI